MEKEQFKQIAIEAFNVEREDNEVAIQELKQTWDRYNSYNIFRDVFDDLMFTDKKIENVISELSLYREQYDSKDQAAQAKYMGTGLFYLYYIYLTVQCMLLMYVDNLFEKYDFPYEYEVRSTLDLLRCKKCNSYPTIQIQAGNINDSYKAELFFSEADFDILKEDANALTLTKLKNFDISVTFAINYVQGQKSISNRAETTEIKSLAATLKKFTTLLKENSY